MCAYLYNVRLYLSYISSRYMDVVVVLVFVQVLNIGAVSNDDTFGQIAIRR